MFEPVSATCEDHSLGGRGEYELQLEWRMSGIRSRCFCSRTAGYWPIRWFMAFFSDSGTEIQSNSSRDGNALLASFDQHETALRSVRRSQGFYGAVETVPAFLNTLQSLTAKEAQTARQEDRYLDQSRLAASLGPGVELDSKAEARLFTSIVAISDALRQARMTLYSVDPLGC